MNSSKSPANINNIPIPNNPIAATVRPIIEPPKMPYSVLQILPFSLAATNVLTLAFVAEYIPMKPAVPEQNAPVKRQWQFAILEKYIKLKYKLDKIQLILYSADIKTILHQGVFHLQSLYLPQG